MFVSYNIEKSEFPILCKAIKRLGAVGRLEEGTCPQSAGLKSQAPNAIPGGSGY